MNKKQIKKAPEAGVISKIRGMIDYLYPGIEREVREEFIRENAYILKLAKKKSDFRLAFHSWFLLKFEFPSGATAMEMADSFPEKFFTEDEKRTIKNFLEYQESLFEIIKILNNKDYLIKDLRDDKEYLINTIDFPCVLNQGEIVQAIIIRKFEGGYFFYGNVTSFDVQNKKEFMKAKFILFELEEEIRKERTKEKIGWEIDRGNKLLKRKETNN